MGRKSLAIQDSIAISNIAGYCMVSTSTVRRWILNGQLLAVKLPSGQYRVRVADFKEFLTKNHISITDELNQLLRSSKN